MVYMTSLLGKPFARICVFDLYKTDLPILNLPRLNPNPIRGS